MSEAVTIKDIMTEKGEMVAETTKIKDILGEEHDAVLVSAPDSPYLEYEYTARIRKYNPNYGDSRKCICGHAYGRHFDFYDGDEDVGCKYCSCMNFIELTPEREKQTGICMCCGGETGLKETKVCSACAKKLLS